MMDKENKLILYKDDEGRVSVNTRFADEVHHIANGVIFNLLAQFLPKKFVFVE